jgi:hypothetical protein
MLSLYNLGESQTRMDPTRQQTDTTIIELLYMKTVTCSDKAFALIRALAAQNGISYSDAIDQLILKPPQESQASLEELAKTKAELQEAGDEVKRLETRLMRRANKGGQNMPKMNEDDWSKLARIAQNGDSSVFMREVRERGLLPYD